METRVDTSEFQQRKQSESASLIELLAAVIIGVFGMFLAELGSQIDNPIIYWSGIVASISAAGWITMKFLTAIWDFIERFKRKDR